MVATENRRVGYMQLVSFATVLTVAVDLRHRAAALSFSALSQHHVPRRHATRQRGRIPTATGMVPTPSSLDLATGGATTRGRDPVPPLAESARDEESVSMAFAIVEEESHQRVVASSSHRHHRGDDGGRGATHRRRQEERRRMQIMRRRRRQIRRASSAAASSNKAGMAKESSSPPSHHPDDGNGWALGWPGTILRFNRRRLAEATASAAAASAERGAEGSRRMSPRPPPPLSVRPSDEGERMVCEDGPPMVGVGLGLGGRPPFLGGRRRQRRVGERIEEEAGGAAAAPSPPSSADLGTGRRATGAKSKGDDAVSSSSKRRSNRPRRKRDDRTNVRQRRRNSRRPPRRGASRGGAGDGDDRASSGSGSPGESRGLEKDNGAQSSQDITASVAVAAIAAVDQTREDESITSSPPDDAQGEGRRITFSAAREATRSLSSLDGDIGALLTPYMTQPVEQYSLLAFHEDEEASTPDDSLPGRVSGRGADRSGDDSSGSDDADRQSKSRRWIVRRLNEDEAMFYRDDGDGGGHVPDNIFRLAVPLMPLIGLDLTPVIDLEVVVNATSCNAHGVDDDGAADESRHQGPRWRPGRWRRRQTEDEIKIRSLRVALLSTEDEVRNAMGNGNPAGRGGEDGQPGDATERGAAISTTARESVQKIGYEAIGMAGRLEGWFRPHLSFDATINWMEGDASQREDSSIRVTASATTSLTIPELPIPLPSGLILKRLGSMLTSRALSLALPQFLRQLERDFRRWASVDDAKQSEGVKVHVAADGKVVR